MDVTASQAVASDELTFIELWNDLPLGIRSPVGGLRLLLASIADGLLDRDRRQSFQTRAQARHSHPSFVRLCSDAVSGAGVDLPLLGRDEAPARDGLSATRLPRPTSGRCLASQAGHVSHIIPGYKSPLISRRINANDTEIASNQIKELLDSTAEWSDDEWEQTQARNEGKQSTTRYAVQEDAVQRLHPSDDLKAPSLLEVPKTDWSQRVSPTNLTARGPENKPPSNFVSTGGVQPSSAGSSSRFTPEQLAVSMMTASSERAR